MYILICYHFVLLLKEPGPFTIISQCHCTSFTEAVIGFIDPPYEFNESDAMASVVVGVVSGSLEADVSIELSFSDGSGFSRFTRHIT